MSTFGPRDIGFGILKGFELIKLHVNAPAFFYTAYAHIIFYVSYFRLFGKSSNS